VDPRNEDGDPKRKKQVFFDDIDILSILHRNSCRAQKPNRGAKEKRIFDIKK
jgi:hypothetical protein